MGKDGFVEKGKQRIFEAMMEVIERVDG